MARSTILALDVGGVRIGVAMADMEVRFANPLTTLVNDETIWQELQAIIDNNGVQAVVVGLPRGLEGQETAQTKVSEAFIEQVRANLGLPVYAQDEAATSIKAEQELKSRGKPFAKGDIDALAATYILEDYLQVGGHNHA